MTEKRFTEIVSTQKVIDNQTGKEYDCLIDDDLLKLLNELHEENEQLKQIVGFLKNDNAEDILNVLNSQENRIWELKQENEQLKQRNDKQCKQLKQLWELIEDENYNTLRSMLNQREIDEKLLQKEWRTYSD